MRALGVTLIVVACLGQALGQQLVHQSGQDLHSSRQFEDPCQTKTRTAPHETQCDAYYSCYHGEVVLQICPNGLMYQGKSTQGLFGVCDYAFNVDCTTRPQTNAPISTEHCEWLYGIFGHETSCTRYWTCWNGTATEQFCIGGLLYSEETHACDWPQNVGGCQKHPLCKEDPNANVPLGKSCERYWACQGGYPRLQRCPATLVFDRASRRCINPPTVDCDIPSTTLPPPRAEQARQGGGQLRGGQQISDQRAAPQRPRVQQARRPQLSQRGQQQQRQQEQEAPLQEQIVDQPVDGPLFEEPLQEEVIVSQPARPQRPRPSLSGSQLPFIPAGATPINLNSGSGPRLPPIPGAIPIRFN